MVTRNLKSTVCSLSVTGLEALNILLIFLNVWLWGNKCVRRKEQHVQIPSASFLSEHFLSWPSLYLTISCFLRLVSHQIIVRLGERMTLLILLHELALYVYLLVCVFMDIKFNTTRHYQLCMCRMPLDPSQPHLSITYIFFTQNFLF
jgi:hypothetical protein